MTVGGVTVFDEGDYTGSGTYTFENVQPTSTGNLIFYAYADEASTLGVDIDNVSVKKEGGEVDFKYDYLGRRVEKTIHDSQTTIHYTYDGDQVIAEYEGSTLKRKFVYGPGIDEPVCMIVVDGQTETKYYYHYDGLGSVIALSDDNGSIVERYSYDVFGEPNRTSNVGNPYLFTGRRYDNETGLYYYRARYYSADLGRFLQTDPIGYWEVVPLVVEIRHAVGNGFIIYATVSFWSTPSFNFSTKMRKSR